VTSIVVVSPAPGLATVPYLRRTLSPAVTSRAYTTSVSTCVSVGPVSVSVIFWFAPVVAFWTVALSLLSTVNPSSRPVKLNSYVSPLTSVPAAPALAVGVTLGAAMPNFVHVDPSTLFFAAVAPSKIATRSRSYGKNNSLDVDQPDDTAAPHTPASVGL
jgi:hypothetical protein